MSRKRQSQAAFRGDKLSRSFAPMAQEQPILGDPMGDLCRGFRDRHCDVPFARLSPLYAIPFGLIEPITRHLLGWLTADELAFERDLARFCAERHAAGIAEDIMISDCLLNQQQVTPADVTSAVGSSALPADATDCAKSLNARLRPALDARLEYVGWLLTNPVFLGERDALRARRLKLGRRASFLATWDRSPDRSLRDFLDRWQLSSLLSWELPIPQGPNLTGAAWPRRVLKNKAHATVEIPTTMRIKARDPIQEVLEEARHRDVPEHLRDWVGLSAKTTSAYGEIFKVHFFRNLVVGSRYGKRFKRNIDPLDEALADYLCTSVDAIRKYRQQIRRRLGRDGWENGNQIPQH